MTKVCCAIFKCENKLKLVEKIMHSFEVHLNESACRKSGHIGLEQVKCNQDVFFPLILKEYLELIYVPSTKTADYMISHSRL